MKKRLLWLGALALVFVLAVPFVLPALIPAAWVREQVAARLQGVVKRPLKIGDVEVRTWWGLKIVVKDLEVGNREGFSPREPFLAVQEFRLKVSLFPLLRRKVAVEELSFSGLQLLLEQDAGGRANWQELVAARPAPSDRSGPGMLGLIGAASPTLVLSADRIRISDAGVVYRDLAVHPAEETRLSGLDLDFKVSDFSMLQEEALLALVRGISGGGDVRVAEFRHPAITLKPVKLRLDADAGKVRLAGTAHSTQGGALSIDAGCDLTPAFSHRCALKFDRFTVGGPFSDRYLASFGLGLASGAVAQLDGHAELAAKGLDGAALWASAAGPGELWITGTNLGQTALFKGKLDEIRSSFGLLEKYLKPEECAKLRAAIDKLGNRSDLGTTFRLVENRIENILRVRSQGQGVFSVSGTMDRNNLSIRYVVTEDSFEEPSLKQFWHDYIGGSHEITGTIVSPDWHEGALASKFFKRAATQQVKNLLKKEEDKVKDGAKDKIEDKVKDSLQDIFKKKKKR